MQILTDGLCECIREPRGDNGLEGFSLGTLYFFQRRNNKKHNTKDLTYYKIFQCTPDGYGECCNRNIFFKHFKHISEVNHL